MLVDGSNRGCPTNCLSQQRGIGQQERSKEEDGFSDACWKGKQSIVKKMLAQLKSESA
jgi:hypothetical protein